MHAGYLESGGASGPHEVPGHVEVVIWLDRILVVALREDGDLGPGIRQLGQRFDVFLAECILQVVNGAPQLYVVLPSIVIASSVQIVIVPAVPTILPAYVHWNFDVDGPRRKYKHMAAVDIWRENSIV